MAMTQFKLEVPDADAARLEKLLRALCRDLPSVTVVPLTDDAKALQNIGHRGDAEKVERMLCDGLVANAERAKKYKLPVLARQRRDYTTESFKSKPLAKMLDRPLMNTTHGNLGADIVALCRDTDAAPRANHYVLHLIQLKRGTTKIGHPKKNCGKTNEGRSSYWIAKKLVQIGEELTALLHQQFPDLIERITCRYYFISTADVTEESKALFAKHDVTLVIGDKRFINLMPEHLRAHIPGFKRAAEA